MKTQPPELLIKNLEIPQGFNIQVDGDTMHIRFVDFKKLQDTKLCSSVSCPICSAMAYILAKISGKPVAFEEDGISPDRRIAESAYRIIEV